MRRSTTHIGVGFLVVLAVMTGNGNTAGAVPLTFQAGVVDGFALPADPSTPSPALVASLNIVAPSLFQDFDRIANVNGGTANTQVGHTFTGLPGGIIGGSLEVRVRAGNNPMTVTDGIILSFVDAAADAYLTAIVHKRTFGPFAGGGSVFTDPDPGLLQSTPWSVGNDVTFTLDLSALPLADGGTLSILSALNSHPFLDVVVSDETGVDFIRLNLDVTPVPEASTFLLLSSGLLGLFGYCWGKRKQTASTRTKDRT